MYMKSLNFEFTIVFHLQILVYFVLHGTNLFIFQHKLIS